MNTHNKKFEICTNELNSSSYTKTDFTCFNAEHSFEESPKINMNTKEENICFNMIFDWNKYNNNVFDYNDDDLYIFNSVVPTNIQS